MVLSFIFLYIKLIINTYYLRAHTHRKFSSSKGGNDYRNHEIQMLTNSFDLSKC